MTLEKLLNKANTDKRNDLEENVEAINQIFFNRFNEYKDMIRELNVFERKRAMSKLLSIFKIYDASVAEILEKIDDPILKDDDWLEIEKSIEQRLSSKLKKQK